MRTVGRGARLQMLRIPLWIGVVSFAAGWAVAQGVPASGDAGISVEPAQQKATPAGPDVTVSTGQINGTVLDADGDVIADAEVTLSQDGEAEKQKASKIKTDADGRFHFGGVTAGKFKLSVESQGLKPATFSGVLRAGEIFETPPIKLDVASARADVEVMASQEDLAEAEIKVEEHQRLVGFMPNFFVTYDWNAAPLATRQKFELAWRNTLDPANLAIAAVSAGVQQALNDDKGFGQGAAGYGKRFGADSGDLLFGTFLGGFVFPALFHQDPRFFYKSTGSVISRALYALSAAVICRGDNGKWQPNYSGVLGDFTAGAISNFYYPASQRNGAGLTIENGFLDVAEDAIGNVVQEFVWRHLTPHAPTYPPPAPAATPQP